LAEPRHPRAEGVVALERLRAHAGRIEHAPVVRRALVDPGERLAQPSDLLRGRRPTHAAGANRARREGSSARLRGARGPRRPTGTLANAPVGAHRRGRSEATADEVLRHAGCLTGALRRGGHEVAAADRAVDEGRAEIAGRRALGGARPVTALAAVAGRELAEEARAAVRIAAARRRG